MKFSAWVVVLLVTLFMVNDHIFKFESIAISSNENLVDLPIGNMDIQEPNIHLVLSKIAYKYKAPIGLEVSPKDNLLMEDSISIHVEGGTLRDVLNAVVSQKPLYTWDIKDNVINVFPKDGNRDPLLEALLETKFQSFYIKKDTSHINFRESLTKSPELKSILEANGVSPENEIFSTRDGRALGQGFSLNVSNATVRSILNQVIKESETKYWIINRYGASKQYLLLNL